MNWHPISIAPRDGSRILLYGTVHTSGANCADYPAMVIVGAYQWTDETGRKYSYEWSAEPHDYYPVDIIPTHWQPLPEPPVG